MAWADQAIADSDLHVMEPPDLWERYIDPAFRHAAPVGLSEWKRDMRVRVKSRVLLRPGPVRPLRASADTQPSSGKTGWRRKSMASPPTSLTTGRIPRRTARGGGCGRKAGSD